MDLELPANLHATRDLLMRSLVAHSEQAPAIPAGLASDLSARFAPRVTRTVVTAPLSWMEKVRGFLSTPAFGIAAAAVVVLGAAAPLLSGPATLRSETFRGELTAASADSVRIIFTGDRPEIRAAVEASATFEKSALCSMNSSAATTQAGPKVIVDLTSSTITAIDRDGATLYRAAVPTEPGKVADAIALAAASF
jgi:hypothetical protein